MKILFYHVLATRDELIRRAVEALGQHELFINVAPIDGGPPALMSLPFSTPIEGTPSEAYRRFVSTLAPGEVGLVSFLPFKLRGRPKPCVVYSNAVVAAVSKDCAPEVGDYETPYGVLYELGARLPCVEGPEVEQLPTALSPYIPDSIRPYLRDVAKVLRRGLKPCFAIEPLSYIAAMAYAYRDTGLRYQENFVFAVVDLAKCQSLLVRTRKRSLAVAAALWGLERGRPVYAPSAPPEAAELGGIAVGAEAWNVDCAIYDIEGERDVESMLAEVASRGVRLAFIVAERHASVERMLVPTLARKYGLRYYTLLNVAVVEREG